MNKVIFVETNNSYLIDNNIIIDEINQSNDNTNDDINKYLFIDIIGNLNSILIFVNDKVYVLGINHNSIDCLFDVNSFIDLITNKIRNDIFLIIRNSHQVLKYIDDVNILDRILDYDCYMHYLNNTFTENKIKEYYHNVNKEINHINRNINNKIKNHYPIINIYSLIDLSIKLNDLMYEFIGSSNIQKDKWSIFNMSVSSFNYLNKFVLNGIRYEDGIKDISYRINSISKRPTLISDVNYLGLSKTSGIRKNIKSRYKDGIIVEIDFQSYHLQLIDNVLNLFTNEKKLNKENNTEFNYHNEMSNIFFNKGIETDEDKKIVKQKIFYLMYNDISNNTNNPKIDKLKRFRDLLISYYDEHKKIKSLKSGGYIYFDSTFNYNKLFNYLMQDLESNTNFQLLREMYLKFKDKYNLILYVYDSFLFDIEDERKLNEFIKDIDLVLHNYIYRLKAGCNYDDMEIININNRD